MEAVAPTVRPATLEAAAASSVVAGGVVAAGLSNPFEDAGDFQWGRVVQDLTGTFRLQAFSQVAGNIKVLPPAVHYLEAGFAIAAGFLTVPEGYLAAQLRTAGFKIGVLHGDFTPPKAGC
jgi:hypothetical protein